MRFEVRRSPIEGSGVFTLDAIKVGESIVILSGERISEDELDHRISLGRVRFDDPLQVGDSTFLILDEFSRSINHSCNPNSGIKNESELVALRDISPGEEITYDYSSVVCRRMDEWEMQCLCGEDICRKHIRSWQSIPDAQLEVYVTRGALPDFILNEMSQKM